MVQLQERQTATASSVQKIDTIADRVFFTVSSIKILPILDIPCWLWIWGVVIAIIKIGNIVWGYVSQKQFVSLHTVMNKITGFLLFLLPLTLSFLEVKYSFVAVCFVATFAAIQECFYIATMILLRIVMTQEDCNTLINSYFYAIIKNVRS